MDRNRQSDRYLGEQLMFRYFMVSIIAIFCCSSSCWSQTKIDESSLLEFDRNVWKTNFEKEGVNRLFYSFFIKGLRDPELTTPVYDTELLAEFSQSGSGTKLWVINYELAQSRAAVILVNRQYDIVDYKIVDLGGRMTSVSLTRNKNKSEIAVVFGVHRTGTLKPGVPRDFEKKIMLKENKKNLTFSEQEKRKEQKLETGKDKDKKRTRNGDRSSY